MAHVILEHADIALFSDPINSRLELPRLVKQDQDHSLDVAFARFEGDEYETGYRGFGHDGTHQFESVYSSDEHQGAVDLEELFHEAYHGPDGRLMIRTRIGRVAGLDPILVVMVAKWNRSPQVGNIIRVSFEAKRVRYSLDVDELTAHSH